MAVLRKLGAFLKDMWARYPLVTASAALYSIAAMIPFFTPYITYADMINQATPYYYPVPVRDDGNMPDIPSHPCDKEGPSLEWLKKL
uniref:NADH dehydrogenase [ubiquinone] 1 alpha subcomplex subunit 3 n=1 Tax=Pelusios castaneus TaxID=367368 RepID=A0A8C8SRG8_9SAUR